MTAPDLDALIAELRRNAAAHFSYTENTLYTNAADALDRLRLEVSILQTTARDVIAAGEAYKAQVQAATALADRYASQGGWRQATEVARNIRDVLDGAQP